jgi:hypothetical protein
MGNLRETLIVVVCLVVGLAAAPFIVNALPVFDAWPKAIRVGIVALTGLVLGVVLALVCGVFVSALQRYRGGGWPP